jgi:hypothetical protein
MKFWISPILEIGYILFENRILDIGYLGIGYILFEIGYLYSAYENVDNILSLS